MALLYKFVWARYVLNYFENFHDFSGKVRIRLNHMNLINLVNLISTYF